jgi:hypothetical protein
MMKFASEPGFSNAFAFWAKLKLWRFPVPSGKGIKPEKYFVVLLRWRYRTSDERHNRRQC